MKPSKYLPEKELISEVIRILTEKFGSLETFRFLSIANRKRNESVKRHRHWQTKLNKDNTFKEIFG
ncbi:MAG: hypothetical protein AMXMBFR48_25950 [Ignavibacteriales bacterium]